MRAAGSVFVLALAAAAGCGRVSPCDGVSGACIGVHIKGNAKGLEQLVITIDQPTTQTVRTPTPPKPIHLPARVALALPAGASGTIDVRIDGVDGAGAPVAHDERAVTLPASGRIDVDFTLDGGTDVGDGGGGDGGVGPDMATGIVISGAVDQIGYELEPVAISFSATDPMSNDLVLTASGVPATATFTPSGADGMLTWTPTLSESGAYPITMTATSASNPSRVGMTPFTLTIKNTIDPMLNPFAMSPDQLLLDPVGDVDGDGAADFAFCTTTSAAGQQPQYSVQIVYGDKTGMPTARPYPMGRTRTITFSGPAGSTDDIVPNTRCLGGDFDADGKSDVLITDADYVAPGDSIASGSYFIVYGTARDDTAAPVTVQLLPHAGDTLGPEAIVGDWNGDGLADFVTAASNAPGAGAGAKVDFDIWEGQFPRVTSPQTAGAIILDHPCGSPLRLLGFASPDGAIGLGGKPGHGLVVYDEAVKADGTFPGTCAAGDGGLRVVTAGTQINPVANVAVELANVLGGGAPVAFCDVDGDKRDELIVATQDMSGVWHAAVVPGSALGWPNVPDLSKAAEIPNPEFGSPLLACWKSAYGPSAFAVGNPGTFSSQGFIHPGNLFLFDVANQTPTLTKTIPNFSGSAADRGFGFQVITAGDVNADGKPDLVIPYRFNGGTGPTDAWVLYGR